MAGDDDVFDDDLNLDELFDTGLDAVMGGEAGGPRKKVCKLETVGDGERSEALELLADEARITLVQTEDGGQLLLEASLANHLGKPLELDELLVVLRDAEGDLLDVGERWINTKFTRAQEVVCEFDVGPGVTAEVARVELVAEYDFEFQMLMALGVVGDVEFLGEVPHRRAFDVDTRVSPAQPGLPSWDVKLAGFVLYAWESEVEVILDMREHGECSDGSREVAIALRDKSGAIIAKETASLDKVLSSARTRTKVTFSVAPNELHGLARIDVAVSGTCARRESLGTFELVGMH